MRLPVKFVVATTLSVVALLSTSAGPASANCAPVFFGAYEHHVFTPGVCDSGPPCASGTSVTDNLTGSFWALGYGNPQSGLGVDNGIWPAREGEPSEQTGWIVSSPEQPAYLGGYWGTDPRTDGCIYSECMAVMLSDQFPSYLYQSYFSVSTRHVLAGGDFVFESDIVLTPIPQLHILASNRPPGGNSLELTTIVNAPTGGVDLDAACPQNVVLGYKVYFRQGSGSGDLSRSNWSLAIGGTGPNGAPIPFGTTTTIVLQPACIGSNYNFAASVVFEGGFETAHLSHPLSISLGNGSVDHDCDGSPSFTEDMITPLDCDDSDPSVYPGAPQICDHRNNDCDDPGWPSIAGTNEDGPDPDGDSWGGVCDNCPNDPDPSRSDLNADGVGDVCDTHDGLILVGFADSVRVSWQEETGFDSWNLYRSSLGTLETTGAYTQAPGSNPIAGRECDLALPMADDAFVPPFGDVALYLVTGQAGGSENDLGKNSAGQTRPNAHPCP